MRKSTFAALLFGMVGGVLFSLGMCLCLVPAWRHLEGGVALGVFGFAILLAGVAVWRRLAGKAPLRLSLIAARNLAVGLVGALVFGAGLFLCLDKAHVLLGTVVGLAGMVVLLLLIPLIRGLRD